MVWHHTVWPEAELVYTSVAKVANTSIKSCLLASFHPEIARRAPHSPEMPYVSVHPNRIRTMYPGYCHFAVVRHPLDRLVSFWADKIVGPTKRQRGCSQAGIGRSARPTRPCAAAGSGSASEPTSTAAAAAAALLRCIRG